jgi:peroxin-3
MDRALNRTKRFLHKHRGSIIAGVCTGVVIAGIVRARRAVNDAISLIDDAERRWSRQMTELHRRKHHLSRIRQECDVTLLRFVASLSSSLHSQFSDSSAIVQQIKQLRERRLLDASSVSVGDEKALWDKLRVVSLTHFMVGFYSFNILHVVIRIQMHILGRYNFIRSSSDGGEAESQEERSPFSREVRGEFLSLTYNFILGGGLQMLRDALSPIVEEIFTDCEHTKKLDCETIIGRLRRVREKFDHAGLVPSPLVKYIMVPDHVLKNACPAAQSMLNETWDIVESPQFAEAMSGVLDKSLEVFSDQILRNIFTSPNAKIGDEADGTSEITHPVTKPVANVINQLKPSKTILVVDNDKSIHAEATSHLPVLQNLCEAIFDSEEDSESEET